MFVLFYSIVDKNEKDDTQNEMMIEENNGDEGEEQTEANKLTKSSNAAEKPQARQLKAGRCFFLLVTIKREKEIKEKKNIEKGKYRKRKEYRKRKG